MAQDYFGTKRITAWPETHKETGAPGYAVRYAGGYTSWSPAHVFEAAYKPVMAMTFGHALEAMKQGHRVARAGWNGEGMWIALSGEPGFSRKVAAGDFWSRAGADYAREQGGHAAVLPAILMRTASGDILMGWAASQTDMLSEDWMIVKS